MLLFLSKPSTSQACIKVVLGRGHQGCRTLNKLKKNNKNYITNHICTENCGSSVITILVRQRDFNKSSSVDRVWTFVISRKINMRSMNLNPRAAK